MKLGSYHLNNTHLPNQQTKNPSKTISLSIHHRHLRARSRRNNTGKERDSETGLYYYGARYLDPKASRWLSGDPAVGEYIPVAPVSDEARKRNGNLPGMGGVYNFVNLHVYHYGGNNPVKYTDPDGRTPVDYEERIRAIRADDATLRADYATLRSRLTYTDMGLPAYGPCYMRALMAVAETFTGRNLTSDEFNQLHTTLTSGNNVAVDINDDYEVKDSGRVIMETLRILEPEKSYKVTVSRPSDDHYAKTRENAAGSLLLVSGHWQEGDKNGRFRWDGLHGLDNSKYRNEVITQTRYVSIERIPNRTRDMINPAYF